MAARLVFLNQSGNPSKRLHLDKSPLVIGTDIKACGARIQLPDVKAKHCQIAPSPSGFVLSPIDKEAVVLVNGQPIAGPTLLSSGDMLKIASKSIRFQAAPLTRPTPQKRWINTTLTPMSPGPASRSMMSPGPASRSMMSPGPSARSMMSPKRSKPLALLSSTPTTTTTTTPRSSKSPKTTISTATSPKTTPRTPKSKTKKKKVVTKLFSFRTSSAAASSVPASPETTTTVTDTTSTALTESVVSAPSEQAITEVITETVTEVPAILEASNDETESANTDAVEPTNLSDSTIADAAPCLDLSDVEASTESANTDEVELTTSESIDAQVSCESTEDTAEPASTESINTSVEVNAEAVTIVHDEAVAESDSEAEADSESEAEAIISAANAMTVVQLRKALKEKGLPTGGVKAELIARLVQASIACTPESDVPSAEPVVEEPEPIIPEPVIPEPVATEPVVVAESTAPSCTNMTVVQLRKALKEKGLPTGGNKAELIERLQSVY